MEICYSNLMHDDGKGVLSLILSLVGLSVSTAVRHLPFWREGTAFLWENAMSLCLN